jgi:hypothetical protein
MKKRHLSQKEIQEAASQQTHELREMARNLSFWLENVHHPSEGQYLEYAVRSYLRRRIPKRFEISTGFISTLEVSSQVGGELQAVRKVSRQFDILIWDADTFPPLFRADDFVIVMPESVRAVIEITKCLDARKMREDLEKFDDLEELYSWERQRFRPYTAILAFSSKQQMKELLQILERFYLFNSSIPIPFRYRTARNKKLEIYPCALPNFIDSICILDRGFIKGRMEATMLMSYISSDKRVVRYCAHANEADIETSFGYFERDVLLNLSQFAAEASGYWESSVDVYREFMHTASKKICGSLIIEDWDSILPSLNVMDKGNPITPRLPGGIANVSNFVGADFVDDHPSPSMYIEHFGPNIWAFEHHPDNIFVCGQYSKGSRVKSWRIFEFNESRSRSIICDLKRGEENLLEILEEIKTTPWRDDPQNTEQE